MRYFSSAAVAALLMLNASALFGQSTPNLAITNYQFVSQTPVTTTLWFVTYKADIVNTGSAAYSSITATLNSVNNGVFASQPGTSTLNFVNVPAGGQVTSTNTFTIRINRSVPSNLNTLQWTFAATPAGVVANAGPNQTAAVGSTVTLNGSGSTNPGGVGSLTYTWSFVSFPPASTAVLHNRTGVNPFFTVDQPGTYVINLTVANFIGDPVDSNPISSSSATVTVSTFSTPPVANAGPGQTVHVGATVTLNGGGSTDVDGQPLTYSWTLTSTPAGSNAALVGATTISPMFVADKVGNYTAQLIVNDSFSNSQPSTVTITTIDTAPVANPGPNQPVNLDALVQLNGAGSTDVDGNPLTYSWALISKPGGSNATLSNPSIVNPTFTADVQGTYVAQLTVNDGFLNSVPATVMITTNTVIAPTANPGPNQKVSPGATVTLSGGGTDPQGLPLTLQWSLITKPTNSTAVLSNTTIPNPTFIADLPGTYMAQLIVNDGVLSSQPANVTITTAFPAPVANAGPAIQSAQIGATVTLDGSASMDFDSQTLTYSWSLLQVPQNSTATLTGANTVSPTFVADLAGNYVAQLIVNDGFTNSNPVTTMIVATSSGTIVLSPNPLLLADLTSGSNTGSLTALLSSPATQSMTLTLSSSNQNAATVPATVTINAGSSGVNIPVTPVGLGSTTITATGIGFGSGQATVNVVAPALSLSLASTVGVTNTVTGTVSLSAPAPSGGVTVSLSASPSGVVDVELPSVTIAAGSSSATFTVTGLSANSAQVTASAAGYASASSNITVGNLGAIQLPATLTVGTNQSATLQVTLATAAPSGGVTVSLASTDTTKATVSPSSVTIQQGLFAPAVQPQVTGVSFGSATINASATGFIGASTTVQVSGTLSFAHSTNTIGINGTQNLVLNLSSPAPSSGLTVNLVSSNTSVATVPATVSFAANASTANVPVTTGASTGTTILTASASNLTSATATANVENLGQIGLASGVTVSAGQSAPIAVTLPAAAPGGGVTVTLSSNNNSIATVTPTVTIAAGQTTPATQPQVTGVTGGSVTITASAPFFTSSNQTVQVSTPLSFPQNSLTITAGTTTNLALNLTSPAPSGGLTVNLSSSSTGAATVPASVSFTQGATTVNVPVTGVAAGPATITASAPGGSATANVTVIFGSLSLASGVVVSPNQSASFPVTLSNPAPAAGVQVVLSTSDPTKVTVSPTTVLIAAGQTSPSIQPTVTGVSFGSANIGASAAGWLPASQAVQVNGTLAFSPASQSVRQGTTKNITLTLSSPAPSGGVTINLSSDTPTVATVPATVTFAVNTSIVSVPVTGVAVGSATIHASSLPSLADTTASITITPIPEIILPVAATVGPGQSIIYNVTLQTPAPANGLIVTLSSANTAIATLSATSVSFAGGSTTPSRQVQLIGVGFGSTTISASAATLTGDTESVQVTTNLAFSPSSVVVSPGSTLTMSLGLGVSPPTSLTVNLSSDNTAVATVPATVTFAANQNSVQVKVTGVSAGLTTIHANWLPNIADTTAAVTVAVPGAVNLLSNVTVAPNQSVQLPVILGTAAPSGGVTVNLSSGATSTLTISPASVTIAAGQTTPATQPQVTGVNYGSTTVTGTATGYTTGSQSVKVAGTMAFSPNTATITTAGPQNLTLKLSSPAPATGLTINLSSLNTGSATVPATVSFAANATSVNVPVTGVNNGTSVITASSSSPTFLPNTTATITVSAPVTVSTTSLPVGTAGAVYSATLSAVGGTGPYTWTASGLPAGLTVNGNQITGLPTAAFSGSVTIKVTDSSLPTAGTSQAVVTLTINQPLAITTASLPPSGVGAAYTTTLSATGGQGPYTWSATGLPNGLTVSGNQITGTPTATFGGNVTIKVTDSTTPPNTLQLSLPLSITTVLTVTTNSLPTGTQGVAYSLTLTNSGGQTPFVWSATGLPGGLTISGTQITGTPTTTFNGNVTIKVTDNATPAATASATLPLVINAPLTITTSSLPSTTVGTAYLVTLGNTGGQSPFVWSATNLPSGLTISGAQITGTPAGTFSGNVTIKVTDSTSPANTASVILGLVVNTPLATTTSTLPVGTQGVAYSVTLTNTGGQSPFVWSTLGLPSGLTISGNQITGTPLSTFSGGVTIKVTDSATPANTAQFSTQLVINAPLTITTTSLPNGMPGAAYTTTLAASGGQTPLTWTATGLPSGLTLSGNQISGTSTNSFNGNVTIKVTDSTVPANTAQVVLSLTIDNSLAVTTTTLPVGTQGVLYTSPALTATGGITPYTFSATGLPNGLTVSAGQISGTPTATFNGSVTIKVTDNIGNTATKAATLVINAPLAITTSSLPAGTQGVAYSANLANTGGQTPFVWSATGLPGGLTISGAQITGTPTATFNGPVTIKVTDSTTPANTASVSLTLLIDSQLAITTSSLPAATQGAAYSVTLTNTGGKSPYVWSSTNLPGGLTISGAQITGTPTATFSGNVTIKVTDSTSPANTASASLALVIDPPLTITTSSLTAGTQGVAYTANLTNTGGKSPYVWSSTNLPGGLTISGAQITGTPTAAFNANVTIMVTDSTTPANTTSVSLPLVIDAPLTITTSSLTTGTQGVAYSLGLTNTGGKSPYVWSATGLPGGLTISGAQITGTPTATFSGNVTIKVTDSTSPVNTASVILPMVINAPLVITTSSLPAGTQGVAYSVTLANTGGQTPYVWSSTNLPGGLTISGNQITGTPTATFSGSVTIKVTDSTTPANTTQAQFVLVIDAPLTITTSSLPVGTQSVAYSVTLANTGGKSPYVWSATNLPGGLTISGAQITGTPTASFNGNVTIKVTDSTSPANTASASLALVINPTLSITTTSLPSGTTGIAYSAPLTATGGQTPYVWSTTGLPSGLTISGSQITGTPTATFSGNVHLTVTDSSTPANSVNIVLGLTIAVPGPAITVSNGTVGQNLQVEIQFTLAQALAVAQGATLTSSDPTKLLVAFHQGDTAAQSVPFTLAAGATGFTAWVQGVPGAGTGPVSVTVSTPGYTSFPGTFTVGPSGFEIAGANGPGNSFSLFAGQTQTLTVTPVQLDSNGNVVATEALCATCSATVQIAENDTTVPAGGVSPSSLNFAGTTGALTTTFTAANVSSQATTTLSATPPAGYNAPNGVSSVFVTVNPSTVSCTNVSVGNGLETTAFCSLNGAPVSGSTLTTITAGPNVLLSTTATGAGSSSINITMAAGTIRTPNFFVIGAANSGTSTYTFTIPSLGQMANGNVTLAPAGIVIAGPSGTPGAGITTGVGQAPSTVSVFSEMLNGGASFTQQTLAGGTSVTVNFTSSSPSVGNVSPTSLTISGGGSSATTSFTPGSCSSNPCSTTLSINTPAGFTANSDQAIAATVFTANLGVCGDVNTGIVIGNKLEVLCSLNLGGQTAGAGGVAVTLTAGSNLLFSNTATGAGTSTLVVTVPSGSSSATYYVQAFASSGNGSYTASASGFVTKTVTNITFTQSAIAIEGPNGLDPNFWQFPASVSVGSQVAIAFVPVEFDPSGTYVPQMLAPGASGNFSVTVTPAVSGVGAMSPTTVTINGGDSFDVSEFSTSTAGSASITITQPSGFSTPGKFTSVSLSAQ